MDSNLDPVRLDSLLDLPSHSFATDPTRPGTLYAGSFPGTVYKSIDGGSSWTRIASEFTFETVTSLLVDPESPFTLIAGTSGAGLFRSLDRGESWAAINEGLPNGNVFALAIVPQDRQHLYAGVVGGLFRSTNGGLSWSDTGLPIRARSGGGDVAVSSSNPSTIYASSVLGGFFRSRDGGEDWITLSEPQYPSGSISPIKAIAIDPINPDLIYVKGEEMTEFTNQSTVVKAGNPFSKARGLHPLRSIPLFAQRCSLAR